MGRKIAVVGAGVAGLAATWMLNDYSDDEVHLFESDTRPGGHANTVDFTKAGASEGESTRVDTGFIVLNTVTYPNFLRFLEILKLPLIASEMSFSVSRDRGLYEWAGTSLSALFAQPVNLFSPAQWRMVWDILRFNAGALDMLRKGDEGESIGDYLKREGFSDAFRNNYLLPMTAAIWSTPPDQAALDFPAFTLLRFMHNHHLLQILDRPPWLTLKSGSHSYVNSILSRLPPSQYHQSRPIHSVSTSSKSSKVRVQTESGEVLEFDHVVFACHADTTLQILKNGAGITDQEQKVLGAFEFGDNRAVLHSDLELMPKLRSTWSAWNYLTSSDGENANVNTVSLTYWMNLLQSIPEEVHGPVFVTLNPPFEPAPNLVAGEWSYMHPLFTEKSVQAQALLPTIQNKRGITFCGAWTKYGFHEDGFSSGMRIAADYLDVSPPFTPRHAERVIAESRSDYLLRLFFVIGEVARSSAVTLLWPVVAFSVISTCHILEFVSNVIGADQSWIKQVRQVRSGFQVLKVSKLE